MRQVIKVVGLGWKKYSRDKFNLFDAAIVMTSIVEMSVEAEGAFSAFRAFRLLRIFRLMTFSQNIKKLIETVIDSLKDLSSFTMSMFLFITLQLHLKLISQICLCVCPFTVLLLFVFIYSLIGMQMFSGTLAINGVLPRSNFDSFGQACVTVFQILTGENWNEGKFLTASIACSALVQLKVCVRLCVCVYVCVLQSCIAWFEATVCGQVYMQHHCSYSATISC